MATDPSSAPSDVAARACLRARARRLCGQWLLRGWMVLAGVPLSAQASLLPPAAVDKAADIIALVALFVVPAAVIALFLYVHILPEKIAERRHHPQKAAIKALCLLSLAFGGLLWPLAWLWAYSRPVAYKLAYGTEKHTDYFKEVCEQAEKGEIEPAVMEEALKELEGLAVRGHLTPELRAIRDRLAIVRSEGNGAPTKPGPGEQRGTV